jgi:hypothetical protein
MNFPPLRLEGMIMSTSTPTSSAPPNVSGNLSDRPPESTLKRVNNIVIYGHSNLIYWWPVWLVAFILAAITYFEGYQMAVVPPGSQAVSGVTIQFPDGQLDGPRDAIIVPSGAKLPQGVEGGGPAQPGMTVSSSNSLGVVFAMTLVVVALVSTIMFRGLVSLIVVILMIVAVLALALLGLWDPILAFFGGLDIRMNAAGYLFIAIPLFLAWLFVTFVYDRQIYMVVDEGQMRYVLEVGDSAMAVQTEGAVVEKKRDDVFRHWLLGFGTGDIVIRLPDGKRIELQNVVNANRKLAIVKDMVRHKPIVISDS